MRNHLPKQETTRQMLLFGLVGGTGTLLNSLLLYLLSTFTQMHYLLAAAIATECAIVWNFSGNSLFTFRGKRSSSLRRSFAKFQAVSMVTLVGTLLILWTLTTLFGEQYLLIWNLFAIATMFVANYTLNRKYTWSGAPARAFFVLAAALLLLPVVYADTVAVTQLGYHPDSYKQVVVYTSTTSGTFNVLSGATVVYSGTLTKAKDSNGNDVECQGNLPCIVGNFSDFTTQGTYTISASPGGTSAQFVIDEQIYSDTLPIFGEFFDATKQQGSSYHADLHTSTFPYMADGSFIMESYQLSYTLTRLGNAYRRNPAIFDNTLKQTIRGYVQALEQLQGVVVTSDPNGFRLDEGMQISNVFYPGPVPDGITTMDVYGPGNSPSIVQADVPVMSLCESDAACIEHAKQYYKCQVDEPCLNLTYVGSRGTITGHSGYGVSTGWYYEFGCYNDVILTQSEFTSTNDPCQIFIPTVTRENTIQALLAYTQAIPAVYDLSHSEGQALYTRSVNTYNYVKNTYGVSFSANSQEAAMWGAALFLLYDYSQDTQYLDEAVALGQSDKVSKFLTSSNTEGQAYYWEEYARHRTAIEANGHTYLIGGNDPGLYFRGSMYNEWNGQGAKSLDKSGERVFQVYRDYGFQNSREMLSIAVNAAKATELNTNNEPFIPQIADSQLAWLTGMNMVQDGVSLNATLRSRNFIFGVGQDQPEQFHSRYLVNTGYLQASGGQVLGARGTGYQFKENATAYQYLDGYSTILGKTYGATGNGWHNEISIPSVFVTGQTFQPKGLDYIPGWINGAYDTTPDNGGDNDIIFNYRDNLNTYEFTETTNEMVATAVELLAYLDGRMNNQARRANIVFGSVPSEPQNATLTIQTTPVIATVTVDGTAVGSSPQTLTLAPGSYALNASVAGYTAAQQSITLTEGQNATVTITLTPIAVPVENATLTIHTVPGAVTIGLNSTGGMTYAGTTNASGVLVLSVPPATYSLLATKTDYTPVTINDIVLAQGENQTVGPITLVEQVQTSHIITSSTNLSQQNGTYHLFETDTGRFSVTLNESATITWTVNGQTVRTVSAASDTFPWTPGILFTSNNAQAIVGVSVVGDVRVWDVSVENVINPYFDDPSLNGAAGNTVMTIHVFTNTHAVNFTNMNVTISSDAGTVIIDLDPTNSSFEMDWKKTQGAEFGNNRLMLITGYNNQTNQTTTYPLMGTERMHFRDFPEGSSGTSGSPGRESRSGGGGGGGGGGAAENPNTPQLVYVILEKDIVGVEDEQTITLDAKIGVGVIQKIDAIFVGPDMKDHTIRLELTQGTNQYGTWSATFGNLAQGQYTLSSIKMYTETGSLSERVRDRIFSVVDQTQQQGQELALIYSVLDSSIVQNGSTVTLRIDARDTQGVTIAYATVESNRGATFTVPLKLIRGDAQYGTWEGSFTVDQPDATYTVSDITLARSEGQEKSFTLSGRSVYVEPMAASADDLLSGNVVAGPVGNERLKQWLKNPLLPTILGFLLMGVTMTVVLLARKPKKHA